MRRSWRVRNGDTQTTIDEVEPCSAGLIQYQWTWIDHWELMYVQCPGLVCFDTNQSLKTPYNSRRTDARWMMRRLSAARAYAHIPHPSFGKILNSKTTLQCDTLYMFHGFYCSAQRKAQTEKGIRLLRAHQLGLYVLCVLEQTYDFHWTTWTLQIRSTTHHEFTIAIRWHL